MISVSVVIPVHNEADLVGRVVPDFLDSIPAAKQGPLELILVENGSSDDTWQRCVALQERYPDTLRPLRIGEASYGAAVKEGILAAGGEVISVLECDALDAGFLKGSVAAIEAGRADLAVASKRHPRSRDKRAVTRRMFTWLLNTFIRVGLGYPGTDTHGLKSMKAAVGKRLCSLTLTGGEIFQTELVLLAWHLGYRVVEMPIVLEEKRKTPVSITKRLPKVLRLIPEVKASLKRFSRGAGGSVEQIP